jgi:intracellular sulfur oxidation DsrE/DsrF family protein
MDINPNRRGALFSFSAAAAGLTLAASGAEAQVARASAELAPAGAGQLKALSARLAAAPRRRDFRTVPMVLDDSSLWDHEAIAELLSYSGGPKQVWDNTELKSPWLNGMRNAMNAQIWSFKHPDFVIVSATHGSAQLALLDQAMWDKYELAKQTDGAYEANTLLERNPTVEADREIQSETGAYSAADNSVAGLMDRGVVFMACHLGLWELSAKLIKQGVNPDHLSQGAMVAEMTNHLAPGVVLTPGMVATIPEFQQAGYHYIK